MAILHGIWFVASPGPASDETTDPPTLPSGRLLIWGEQWQRPQALSWGELVATDYPLALPQSELLAHLQTWQQQRSLNLLPDWDWSCLRPTILALPLPTQLTDPDLLLPIYSLGGAEEQDLDTPADPLLFAWLVPCLELNPAQAIGFLSALPLQADASQDSFVGGDLRFWSHVIRWSTDLLVRAKFLPVLKQVNEQTWQADWQPLLDSATDRSRFQLFANQMPTLCRFATQLKSEAFPQLCLPQEAGVVLKDFLQQVMAAQIRPMVDGELLQSVGKAGTTGEWLKALSPAATAITTPKLVPQLDNWIAPLQTSLLGQNHWRICFQLLPPQAQTTTWQLVYLLQSVDQPQIMISADQIWRTTDETLIYQGQTLARPQETLLLGLGLASRLYPPIEASLHAACPQECPLTPTQVYEFLKAGSWRLEDSGFVVLLPPSLLNREGWANRLGLKIRANVAGKTDSIGLASLLNFKWELSIGGQTLSKAEFDRLVAQNTPLVEINGEWVELRPQDIKAAQGFFAARKNQAGLTLEDALRLSTGDTLALEKLPVVSFEVAGSLQELLATLTGNQTIAELPAPRGFKGTLRPYQSRGVGWLTFLEKWGLGACLADDMGLGKTIQLIAFILHQRQEQRLQGTTLLVCPTSVLGNWEREVHRFAPELKVLIHHGSQRPQAKAFAKAIAGQDLVITSYPLIYRDQATLAETTWQYLVLDEAQNIKNAEARQSQAVRQLRAQFRIALTGTPLENRLTELWSILDFLNPGYLGPRNFFQRRFATPIERYGDTASLTTLRSLVQPFILRRLKTDRDIIQDLPDKQEMTVFCGLTPEQASLYEQVVQSSLTEIESADGMQRRGLILATLTKLKQICNHPAQFLKEATASAKPPTPQRSAKLRRLEEMLEEAVAEGDRALVFTQFAEMGKLLQQYLSQQLGWETLFLSGSTSKPQREAMVDRFQLDPQGPRIFILSLKAGGVGLNLTRANHVFHFDRWWNPAVENQATDRVFRIGQTRNVQVHKFVCTGTLEERIHEQIEAKKALADQVVGSGENWLTELDTDQLRNLLVLDRTAVIEDL